MKKYIVTTTINEPTEATIKFCQIAALKEWTFVIVGDLKTPHESYRNLEKQYNVDRDVVVYLDPEQQEKLYPELSEVIGWKTIQRRNIGFVYAYDKGVDILATVDDDNIPYENWGNNLCVGREVEVDVYRNKEVDYFDPLSVTNHSDLWHRGYPIQYVPVKNNIEYLGKKRVFCKIEAQLWDGDPDIDAICRLSKKPIVKFAGIHPFTSTQPMPFNSQNTFMVRSVIPFYSVYPGVGRMDDIWGGYFCDDATRTEGSVVFSKASVYQARNPQDLITNLEKEIIGYRHTLEILDLMYNGGEDVRCIPSDTSRFLDVYLKQFERENKAITK